MSVLILFGIAIAGYVLARRIPVPKGPYASRFVESLASKVTSVSMVLAIVAGIYLVASVTLFALIQLQGISVESLANLDAWMRDSASTLAESLPEPWQIAAAFVLLLVGSSALTLFARDHGRDQADQAPALFLRALTGGRRLLDIAATVLLVAASATFLNGSESSITTIPAAALAEAQEGFEDLVEETEEATRQIASEELVRTAEQRIDPQVLRNIRHIYRVVEAARAGRTDHPRVRSLQAAYELPASSRSDAGGRTVGRGLGGTEADRIRESLASWSRNAGPGDAGQRTQWLAEARQQSATVASTRSTLPEKLRKAAIGAVSDAIVNPGNIPAIRAAVADNPALSLLVDIAVSPLQGTAEEFSNRAYAKVADAVTRPGASRETLRVEIADISVPVPEADLQSGRDIATRIAADQRVAASFNAQARPGSTAGNRPAWRGLAGSGTGTPKPPSLPTSGICPPGKVWCMCGPRPLGCRSQAACIPGTPCR